MVGTAYNNIIYIQTADVKKIYFIIVKRILLLKDEKQ